MTVTRRGQATAGGASAAGPSGGQPAVPGPATPLTGRPTGKALLSVVAAAAGAGAFTADWNRTHVFNPLWPAHAKFHNAQTMVSAVQLGALSLWQLWGRPADRSALRWGTLFAGLYWASQAPAILFPGTALADDEFASHRPGFGRVPVNQLTGTAGVITPLLVAGYVLESRRLRRAGR